MNHPDPKLTPVAAITGAAQGIGRRTAEVLAERGYRLVLIDLNSCDETRRAAEVHGAQAMEFTGSVADEPFVYASAASVEAQWGAPDVVVNNAGISFIRPSEQTSVADFRRVLLKRFDVSFNHLYAIANMPISRFLDFLIRSGNLEGYMERLVNAFNPAAVEGLMCRNTLSVGWDGRLYDCDFNQMLDLEVLPAYPAHIREFDYEKLRMRRIVTGRHCYGCTAGAGSSCGGSIVS